MERNTHRWPALICLLILFASVAVAPVVAAPQAKHEAVVDPQSPSGIPFTRYTTTDTLGRKITFYLGTQPDTSTPAPLVVFILGSGAHSNFIERDGRILDGHRHLREALAGRARLLIVEKPGIPFLYQPEQNGLAVGAPEEFLREHTLDRWSEAVSSAISAALSLPQVVPGPLLVAGHSEGSRTAFRVAAKNSAVTHVAGLAGFTTSHLRCFISDPNWGRREFEHVDSSQERAEAAIEKWREILAESDEYHKLFSGHSYRYWASVSGDTSLDFAMGSDAQIYLAQGTADGPCAVEGFELLRAQLIERGRSVTAERIEGADHGFALQDGNGWEDQMQRVVNWYLDAK